MSLWKTLFGGGSSASESTKTLRSIEHNGYLIEAQPYPESGQYQVAGTVSKTINGERKVHRFVRADRFGGAEDAAEVAIVKGKQIVDQQGDRMFEPRG